MKALVLLMGVASIVIAIGGLWVCTRELVRDVLEIIRK